MEYRVLGESELAVSAICMGCWALAGDRMWGPQDEEEAIAALRTAVEVGINFFDTAEGYGNGRSESILGRAFRDIRDKVVIATKVSTSHMRPADLRRACENSLRRLQTDSTSTISTGPVVRYPSARRWGRWPACSPRVKCAGSVAPTLVNKI